MCKDKKTQKHFVYSCPKCNRIVFVYYEEQPPILYRCPDCHEPVSIHKEKNIFIVN